MKRLGLLLSLFGFISILCAGQSRIRRLPSNINHPAINLSSPYISLDGNSLVFISDNSDENQLTMFYSTKRDAVNWNDPQMMPRTVNNRLNFLNGFALSPDGRSLLLSSLKSGGLGGFDIVMSQLRGNIWSEPANLGLPINSSGHEAAPSISPDETALYFMRCEKMDQKSASGCKILVSRKSRLGRWEEPTELPDYINTGNSQVPRILGDSETLIFSSNQLPDNKGGMDLYMTRYSEGNWSRPVALAFANTASDDQFVSASSLGRYLLKHQSGQRSSEIVEILFPSEFKPKATVKIDGKVTGVDNLASPFIAAFDLQANKRVYSGRPERDGSFTFFLKEGTIYDVSVEPERENYTYFSKIYDLTDQVPQFDKIEAPIKPLTTNTEINLAIDFEPHSVRIAETSNQEIRRLARMIKGNSDLKFKVGVNMFGYDTDSIQSGPDLTEIIVDTIRYKVERTIPDTVKIDSLLSVLNELDSIEFASADSLVIQQNKILRGQIDSVRSEAYVTVLVDAIKIKKTFHNDRTVKQMMTLLESLKQEGAPVENIITEHKAVREPDENRRRTEVRLLVEKAY